MKKKSLNVKTVNPKIKILYHLKDKKINKIYNIFKFNSKIDFKDSKIAVGVSGGVDSLALAFFLKCLSLEKKLKIYYFHVNHHLRIDSSNQAKYLSKFLIKFGIKIQILKWKGPKPISNIQKIAREKRYELIFNKMDKYNIKNLFIAHHKGDLMENFIIRLIRGSGLDGLTSFNNIHTQHRDKNIFRPLININKQNLNYISNKVFKFYISDSSNYENKFQRTRVRNILNNLKKEGLDISKMNLTIKNLTYSNLSINFLVRNNIETNCHLNCKKNIALFNNDFLNKPEEIVFRSISQILSKINRNYYPPRGKKIIRLINDLKGIKFKKTTLAMCVIEKYGNTYIITRENGKKK